MGASMVPFDTSQYDKHAVSSFIYELVLDSQGNPADFRVVYASDLFIRDWRRLYHNDNYLGALLREHTLMNEYSLSMMARFATTEPFPFSTYMPLVNMHVYFEPIPGLPAPYAGFYVTDVTDSLAQDTQAHFLRNIRQMGNNAVLLEDYGNGHYEAVFVSGEFADMMECSVAEAADMMSGMRFYKSTAPEDRPLVRSMLKHRMACDGSATITIRKLTAKGKRIWCAVHYAFIDDFDTHYIYCTFTDVTAMKQYEERLRGVYASMGKTFYQETGKTLALFRVNLTRDRIEEAKGRDLYLTDTTAASFSECIHKRSATFPVAAERRLFLQNFEISRLTAGYLTGSAAVSQMLFSIRQDGSSCFVRFTAALTRHPLSGDIIAFLTEQECNDEKVQELLISRIMAQQFDMVCYLSEGRYQVTIGDEASVQGGSIFPASLSGSYQEYLETVVRPALAGSREEQDAALSSLCLETVEEHLANQDPYVVTIAIERGGETYYKEFDFYTVNRESRFYILLKRDITQIQQEQMALNSQLRTALDAANQANIAKTAFLSSMSHEIRTPMNAIIGLDNIALSDPDLPERTREHLEKIGGSARHLLGLINDILDMSRIESGRLTLRHEDFSFAGMLEQINTMIHSQCQDRGLAYECRIIGHVDGYYIGDDMKLKQVLINILGNAVKFTPAPGTIRFTVQRMTKFQEHSTIRFVIQDTGIGMDKAFLPKIFEAFSQEEENRANKFGSTGLGMAITKSIVEMMNGNISVESEKGVGSTFTVNVTLRNSDRQAVEEAEGIHPEDLRVLVIDDDPVDCDHARLVLEEIGVPADICRCAKEALDAVALKTARQEAYNLIFVDWKMPDQDGIAVAREIRRISGTDSAVVVLTAYNWEEVESEAIEAGVDCFLSKPLLASNILSVYHQVMESRRTREDAEEPHEADLHGRRVLVAEDMPINAEILMELLEMEEIQADHAENGQTALEMFREKPAGYYDAVLMDMRMPVMDGLAASRAIRDSGRPDSRTIPIIALTANAFDEDVQRSLQAGMNAHLSKPVEPDQLFKTLSGLIRD